MPKGVQYAAEMAFFIRRRRDQLGGLHDMQSIRVMAMRMVALNEGIKENSLRKSVRAALRPEVQGIDEFDRLVADWIMGDDLYLVNLLQNRATYPNEQFAVDMLQ